MTDLYVIPKCVACEAQREMVEYRYTYTKEATKVFLHTSIVIIRVDACLHTVHVRLDSPWRISQDVGE